MGRREHDRVYVVERSKDVLLEARLRKANPGYIPGKPCLYVGMAGLNPDVRFDQYKADIMQMIGVCALLGLAYSLFM